MVRIVCLSVPCPSHINFNVKIYHFAKADTDTDVSTDAMGSAIALSGHSYRKAENDCLSRLQGKNDSTVFNSMVKIHR